VWKGSVVKILSCPDVLDSGEDIREAFDELELVEDLAALTLDLFLGTTARLGRVYVDVSSRRLAYSS
jgi:hypothetical protein